MSRLNASKFKKVTHVLFDMDGVLLDTEDLYTEAVQNIVGKYGKQFNWTIKVKMMGLQGRDAAEIIIKDLDLPITPEEYMELAFKEYEIIMHKAQVTPDSECIYKHAIANIAKRFGKVYTSEIMSKVIGTPEKESSRIAVTEMKLPMSVESFQKEFHETSHKFLHNVPLMPGARKLVNHLHKHKIPIAIATSSALESFKIKTNKHQDFFNLFDHVVCGGNDPEVKHGKPAPDIFLVCASRFKERPNPDNCLVFEDAPNGVAAAIAAGMQVVMVPDENVPLELTKDAHVVVRSLDETDLSLFGLPPMK